MTGEGAGIADPTARESGSGTGAACSSERHESNAIANTLPMRTNRVTEDE